MSLARCCLAYCLANSYYPEQAAREVLERAIKLHDGLLASKNQDASQSLGLIHQGALCRGLLADLSFDDPSDGAAHEEMWYKDPGAMSHGAMAALEEVAAKHLEARGDSSSQNPPSPQSSGSGDVQAAATDVEQLIPTPPTQTHYEEAATIALLETLLHMVKRALLLACICPTIHDANTWFTTALRACSQANEIAASTRNSHLPVDVLLATPDITMKRLRHLQSLGVIFDEREAISTIQELNRIVDEGSMVQTSARKSPKWAVYKNYRSLRALADAQIGLAHLLRRTWRRRRTIRSKMIKLPMMAIHSPPPLTLALSPPPRRDSENTNNGSSSASSSRKSSWMRKNSFWGSHDQEDSSPTSPASNDAHRFQEGISENETGVVSNGKSEWPRKLSDPTMWPKKLWTLGTFRKKSTVSLPEGLTSTHVELRRFSTTALPNPPLHHAAVDKSTITGPLFVPAMDAMRPIQHAETFEKIFDLQPGAENSVLGTSISPNRPSILATMPEDHVADVFLDQPLSPLSPLSPISSSSPSSANSEFGFRKRRSSSFGRSLTVESTVTPSIASLAPISPSLDTRPRKDSLYDTSSAWARRSSAATLPGDPDGETPQLESSGKLAVRAWDLINSSITNFNASLTYLSAIESSNIDLIYAKAEILLAIANAALFGATLGSRVPAARDMRQTMLSMAEVHATWAAREVSWDWLATNDLEGEQVTMPTSFSKQSWRADRLGRTATFTLLRVWWFKAVTAPEEDESPTAAEERRLAKNSVDKVSKRMRQEVGMDHNDIARFKRAVIREEGELDNGEVLFWTSVSKLWKTLFVTPSTLK